MKLKIARAAAIMVLPLLVAVVDAGVPALHSARQNFDDVRAPRLSSADARTPRQNFDDVRAPRQNFEDVRAPRADS